MRSNHKVLVAVLAVLTVVPLLADVASIRELVRGGRFAEAVAACDLELKSSPRSAPLYTLKGLALASSGDRQAGLVALRQAISLDSQNLPALQAAAQIEFDMGDANAVHTLESIVRLNPSSGPAHAMLGSILFQQRSCDRAVASFEKVANLTPSLRWQYGICLLDVQRWPDAAKQFTALLELRDHAPTRYNLGLSYWNAKNFAAAITALSPMEAQATAVDVDAMRLLASAYEAAGDTPKALEILQKALARNPGEEPLLIDLAVLCMDHKALDLGVQVVRAGIARKPESARLHTLLGVLRVRQGEVDSAKAAFLRAQELAPETGLGRIGIASSLMQMGLAADAVKILREQIAASGPDSKTELTLARALLLEGGADKTREVVGILERVARQEPLNAAARGLLGKAYLQAGETSKAAVELAEAIRLDPTDRASTYQLMTIQKRAGRTKEAADLARKVNELIAREKAGEAAAEVRFQAVRDDGGGNTR